MHLPLFSAVFGKQDTIEALKRDIVRNPKSDEYRKALKAPANASPSSSKS